MIMRLFNFIVYIGRLVKSALLLPIRRLTRTIRKNLNVRSKARKLVMKTKGSIQKKVKVKPDNINDYIEFRHKYVAKSLFIIIPVAIIVLIFLFFMYVRPWLISKYFTAVFYQDNERIATYNGKVNLLERENDSVVYEGKLENGLKTGYGKVYAETGTLIYEGYFQNDLYEGYGKLYDEKGRKVYEGDFSGGMMEGTGTYFYPDSNAILYKGGFTASQFDGNGIMYNEKGSVSFKGIFSAGEKNGQGMEYHENGLLKYSGSFVNGSYNGQGILYDSYGNIIYEGEFQNNAYNGKGKLYYEKNSGWYEGDFKDGLPNGMGKIYQNGIKVYEGEMFSGMKHGEGRLFSQFETPIYQGFFFQDEIPFADMIGKETKEIVTYFTGKSEFVMFEYDFLLVLEETGCAFLINYADMENPAVVQKAYIWESENPGLVVLKNKNLNLSNMKDAMGEPSGKGIISSEQALASAAQASGHTEIIEGDLLKYMLYIIDGYEYRFHYMVDSEEFVVLTIGEVQS
ncbi:MAG: MORN repeat-containing protein [Acetivibrionales bacterium]|jgi:hypothetical protein